MKTLALLSLSLAVALGLPLPDVAQVPVLNEGDQIPLQGEWLPVQGHVVAQDPVPQVRVDSKEQQEPEVKVKPEAKVEAKVEPELKTEPEVKSEPVVQVQPEVKTEPEAKMEPEVKAEPEAKAEPEVKEEPEIKTEAEVKVEHEHKVEPQIMSEQEVHIEQGLKDDAELKVESELEFKVDTEPELIPLFDEEQEFQKVEEAFLVQMKLEPEESHELDGKADMVRNYEMMSEPIMELEPLDDDDMFGEEASDDELLEMERSVQATFQNQDPEVHPLPEEEGLVRERNYVLDPEPIMELEPLDDDDMFGEEVSDAELLEMERSVQATFQNQDPDLQLVPEEEQLIKERTYNLDPEPIMELEPEMNK